MLNLLITENILTRNPLFANIGTSPAAAECFFCVAFLYIVCYLLRCFIQKYDPECCRNTAFEIISQRKYPVKVTYAKSTKKGAKRYSKSLYCKVTVKNYLFKSVKQTELNKLEATITGDTSAIKASDFVITNTDSKANIAVKSIAVDATDKTKVTIETYVAMNDGKDYTVVFDGTTKTFTATDGKAVSATITPATVTVPTPDSSTTDKYSDGIPVNANDIKVAFVDSIGVKVMEITPAQARAGVKPDGFSLVEISVDATNNGYLSGNTLTLYKAGNSAKVKVIAHTGNYDASAQEVGNITAESTITGVDAVNPTTTGYNVKIVGKKDANVTKFANVKDSKVAVGDRSAYAYIQEAKSDNKTAKIDISKYSFESSDLDVMSVSAESDSDLEDASAVKITPYKAGNAYITVKDTNKKTVVATLPVTIGSERKAATLSLDKNAFTLSGADGIDSTVEVNVTVKDQYGDDFTSATDTLKCVKASDQDVEVGNVDGKKITVSKPDENKDQSVTYIVKYGDLKATFVITVKKADTDTEEPATYALELGASSVDAVIKAGAENPSTVKATVCGYDKNGVKVKEDVSATFALTKDGKEAKDATNKAKWENVSSATINVNQFTGEQMAVGTYLVTATVGTKKLEKTFAVTNSQPVATASLKETVLTATKNLSEILKVTYNGKELSTSDFSVVDDPTISGTYHVGEFTLKIKVADGKFVQQKISLGKTVTVKNS